MQNYVEFSTAKELGSYAEEVKKNNLSIIGTSSESPLEVGEYEGTITGNMSRIVGKTNANDWCIFLTEVSRHNRQNTFQSCYNVEEKHSCII